MANDHMHDVLDPKMDAMFDENPVLEELRKRGFDDAVNFYMQKQREIMDYSFNQEEKDVLLAFAKLTGFQLPF